MASFQKLQAISLSLVNTYGGTGGDDEFYSFTQRFKHTLQVFNIINSNMIKLFGLCLRGYASEVYNGLIFHQKIHEQFDYHRIDQSPASIYDEFITIFAKILGKNDYETYTVQALNNLTLDTIHYQAYFIIQRAVSSLFEFL